VGIAQQSIALNVNIPAAPAGLAGGTAEPRATLVGAIVVIVSVADPAVAWATVAVLLDPKLTVGTFTAPAGLEETVAESATEPAKPPADAMVIVNELPVVAPAATVTAVPEMENPGGVRLIE